MTLLMDTHEAIRRLREGGHSESQAEAIVELLQETTSQLVTRDYLDSRLEQFRAEVVGELRAEMYRILFIHAGVVIGAVVALVKLLPG